MPKSYQYIHMNLNSIFFQSPQDKFHIKNQKIIEGLFNQFEQHSCLYIMFKEIRSIFI